MSKKSVKQTVSQIVPPGPWRCFGCHYAIKDYEHYVIPEVHKKWPDGTKMHVYSLQKQFVFHVTCFVGSMVKDDY